MAFENFDNDLISGIKSRKNFSFSAFTTYGCGGYADRAFFPQTEAEACALYSHILKSGKKFCILGCGSDVLAQDGYYDGYVICTCGMNRISFPQCTELNPSNESANVSDQNVFLSSKSRKWLEKLGITVIVDFQRKCYNKKEGFQFVKIFRNP